MEDELKKTQPDAQAAQKETAAEAEAPQPTPQPAYLQDLSPIRLGALLALGAAAGLLLWQLVHHRRKRAMHS